MILFNCILKYNKNIMTTAVQDNNTDLLILSDEDTTTDTLDLNVNDDEINTWESELITFDDNLTEVNTSEVKVEEDVDPFNFWDSANDTLDFSSDSSDIDNLSNEVEDLKSNTLDLSDFNTENIDSDIVSNELDSNNTLNSSSVIDELDLTSNESDLESSSNEGISVSKNINNVWSMTDIIDRAMNEMLKKSDINVYEINTEETHKSELKEQISNLEAQVLIAEEQITELNSEQAMITKNIKSLELMKNSNVTTDIKNETSVKVHNVKRRKAA